MSSIEHSELIAATGLINFKGAVHSQNLISFLKGIMKYEYDVEKVMVTLAST